MSPYLSRETPETLSAILRDIEELLEEPVAEEPVESEAHLRVLVPVIRRERRLLVMECERAEAFRVGSSGRAFLPAPKLGTLLRLARLEVRKRMKEA